MDAAAAFAVFQRWLATVNLGEQPRHERLDACASAELRITRHHPSPRGEPPGRVAEQFAGRDAVLRWLERTPPKIVFALAGEPRAEGDRWAIEYALSVEDYANGGVWLARIDDAGLIAELDHCPFPLPGKGS